MAARRSLVRLLSSRSKESTNCPVRRSDTLDMITHGGSTSRPNSRESVSAHRHLNKLARAIVMARMALGSLAQASYPFVVNQSQDQSVVRTVLYVSTSPVVYKLRSIQHDCLEFAVPCPELRSGGQGERVRLAVARAIENEVAAVDEGQGELTVNIDSLWDRMRAAVKSDVDYERRLQGKQEDDKWERRDGLLWSSDGAVWVPNDRELRTLILQLAHDWAGHFGISRTLSKVRQHCVWDGMTREVEDYCRSCVTCALHKSSNQRLGGTLTQLPIPAEPWDSIGIDFVGPLPPSATGNDTIMVVVDRLSKMVLLSACKLTINGKQAGILALNMLLPLLALPKSIVSDRDVRFTGSCWSQMWAHIGTRLDMSTAYHPQTDGQTERTNRTVQTLLRMYVTERKGD